MSRIIITRPAAQPDYDVRLPMSKSIVNRMLILEPDKLLPRLAEEKELCDDLKVMAEAVRTVKEKGGGNQTVTLDLQASGTAMRFITALCAVSEGTWLLTGTERLRERPVGPLVDALRQAGAEIDYQGKTGFPPLLVTCHERPEGGRVEIDGSESSQYISALMLVADRFRNGLNLYIKGVPASVPYINMTRKLIDGWKKGEELVPEQDWSAAAFWLEIKYLMGRFTAFDPEGIRLTGLREESLQGDKAVRHIFDELERCQGVFEWDFRNCPDLVQPLVVSCCMAGVPFRFTGVGNLRLKETDRLAALRNELGKMGIEVAVENQAIYGLEQDRAVLRQERWQETVETYRDHRMAMAFAGCAVRFGKVVINEPEVVGKSYPGFWEELKSVGFGVEELPENPDYPESPEPPESPEKLSYQAGLSPHP